MDDEGEVGFVETHAERGGGRHDLHVVVEQLRLDGEPRLGVAVTRVGHGRDALVAQPVGDDSSVADGEAVHDAGTRQVGNDGGQPRQPLCLRGQVDDPQRQTGAGERAAQDQQVVTELTGHIGHHPVVRGRGAGQHGHTGRQHLEHARDASIVGPEVVTPVADAMGLVDDEQTAARAHHRQHLGAEAPVGEPLGRDQQQIDLVAIDRVANFVPLGLVRRVEGDRAYTHAGRGLDLVAHERQERAHEDGGPRARLAQDLGGDEVDGALAPSRALHEQHPASIGDEGADRFELIVAELGIVAPGEAAQKVGRPCGDVRLHERDPNGDV